MKNSKFFEVVHYLRWFLYPLTYNPEEKKFVAEANNSAQNGHLFDLDSEIRVLHRSNTRTKLSHLHSSDCHLPSYKLKPLISKKKISVMVQKYNMQKFNGEN